jgi:hypothetical protein
MDHIFLRQFLFVCFFHEWTHSFNPSMGAPNGKVVPELNNIYKSSFYLETQKEGEAILDEKLHHNGMLPKDVTVFAPCQVGGFKGS